MLIIFPAVTLEVIDERLTPPTILTFVQLALVYFLLAQLPAVAGAALTEVSVHLVEAGGVVTTGRGLTVVYIDLTVDSSEASLAVASVGTNQVLAGTSRLTGMVFTVVDILKNSQMITLI